MGDFLPVYLDEGEKLAVAFDIEGEPYPNITCFRNNKEIIFCPSTSKVCINGDYKITRSDGLVVKSVYYLKNNGEYMCVAANPGGSANVTFLVNISGKCDSYRCFMQ